MGETVESEFEWAYRVISSRIPLTEKMYNLAKSLWEKRTFEDKKEWAAAAFYTAIKTSGCFPFGRKDFVEWFGYSWNERSGRLFIRRVLRYYRTMLLDIGAQPKICYAGPDIYIKYYGGKLGFDKRSIGFALRLAEEVRKRLLSGGKAPETIAAAILYITALEKNLKITQREISHATKYTEPVIRATYVHLIHNLKDYAPNAFKFHSKFKSKY
jgi:transcription initiation factor TFIIIB Brf1 subunit/transcription initiation factor TFIIB